MMTTLATVLGLIPMALALEPGSGTVCSAGSRHPRWTDCIRHRNRFLRTYRLPAHPSQGRPCSNCPEVVEAVQSHVKTIFSIAALVCLTSLELGAQTSSNGLPNAPRPGCQPLFLVHTDRATGMPLSTTTAPPSTPVESSRLSPAQQGREDRTCTTIHISISSQLIAKVQHQAVREGRADELPNLNGNVTAVEANDGSRLSSGSFLTDVSRLLNHSGGGVSLSQLITDFGHTSNLVASEKLQEKARIADLEASREDIVLATDQVFFQVLEAQQTLKVASQTVASRQE